MNLEELVKRCRNHDEEAVTELINETKTSGFFVARMITGNDADAEEVLQNAYIKIFNNLDALRDDKTICKSPPLTCVFEDHPTY